MIEAHSLSKTFRTRRGAIEALKNVTVSLPSGITVLIGANGSGKSTLIRVLCTIESADDGGFSVLGRVIDSKARSQYRSKIGYVPQDVRFVPTMTCKDALAYAGWVAGMQRKSYIARIPEVLNLVELPELANARVNSLSGGQNRRIGIAAALMHKPSILFFDEPTAGLDPQARIEVRKVLREVGNHATVVLSTHLADDVSSLAEHVIALNEGLVAYQGDWAELVKMASKSTSANQIGDELELSLAYLAQMHSSKEPQR